jgi:hypothetical protein
MMKEVVPKDATGSRVVCVTLCTDHSQEITSCSAGAGPRVRRGPEAPALCNEAEVVISPGQGVMRSRTYLVLCEN